MIAKLRGLLDGAATDSLVVDVNGVGYLVFASARTLRALPARGGTIELHIETHVREDHIHLYGFATEAEREWFRLLLTVQGVGAKVAMALLSALSPDELANAIAAQDRTTITRAQGVGPKLAVRLLMELKDKVGAFAATARASSAVKVADVNEDAVSALVNLGYRRAEAYGAVARAAQQLGDKSTLDGLIRAGLKELAP
jgi:holliday junction DNA helicase RuvA